VAIFPKRKNRAWPFTLREGIFGLIQQEMGHKKGIESSFDDSGVSVTPGKMASRRASFWA
jgi:hypothetical protein